MSSIYTQVVIGVVVFYILINKLIHRAGYRKIVRFNKLSVEQYYRLVLLGIGMILASDSLLYLMKEVFQLKPAYQYLPKYLGLPKYICFIYAVVLAPFIEEILFRGILLYKLRKYGQIKSWIISSGIFALLHIVFYKISPILIILFFSAVFLCIVVFITDSILSAIVIHMIKNLFVFLTESLPDYSEIVNKNFLEKGAIVSIVIMGMSITMLVFLIKKLKKDNIENDVGRDTASIEHRT